MNPGAGKKIAFIDEAHPSAMRKLRAWLGSWWRGMVRLSHREPRRLRLGETLAFGDRRFVAVIEFEKARFLVGGTHTSLSLLARLDGEGSTFPSGDAVDTEAKTGSGEKLS
jgi:flagellar biogenesis protein FliO